MKDTLYAVKKGKQWWNREQQDWTGFDRACMYNHEASAERVQIQHGGKVCKFVEGK